MAKKTRIEKRNIVNSNTIHTIELGFAADQTALTTNRKLKGTNETKYFACDLSEELIWVGDHYEKGHKTPFQTILSSHFGKEPVFDQFRSYKNPALKKRGNVISPIRHPNMWVYDFDNHDKKPELRLKLHEIYERLHQYKEFLVGYSEDYNGLHVFCLTTHKSIVEQEAKEYEQIEGAHVDVFNCKINNKITVPGFDHYLYYQKDIERFKSLLDVKIEGRINIYQLRSEQKIKYPAPIEVPQEELERTKIYKDSAANIKLHLAGIKNCIRKHKNQDNTNDIDFINTLMKDVGKRTEFLLSSDGHVFFTKFLANSNIRSIDTFKKYFSDFEDNHYALIEQMIQYIEENNNYQPKNHKTINTNYTKQVNALRSSIEQWFKNEDIEHNKNLLSVATYLTNCIKHNITSPGYVHYIEFCKMNEEKPVPKSTYFDQVKKCEEYKWISIPKNNLYIVGKKCRNIEEGFLLRTFIEYAFKLKEKKITKVFNYIEVNSIYNTLIYNIKTILSLPIILCSPKHLKTHQLDIFNMKDFYSLRL